MTYILLFTAAWLICGYYAAGYFYAYFQREYPLQADNDRREDASAAAVLVVFGLSSLIAMAIWGTHHGRLYPWQQGGDK